MTGLVVVAAVLAVLLWPHRGLDRPAAPPSSGRPDSWWRAERRTSPTHRNGDSPPVLAPPASVRRIIATLVAPLPPALRRRCGSLSPPEEPTTRECADLAEALVPCLEAGLTAGQAATLVEDTVPLPLRPTLARLAAAGHRGEPAPAVLAQVPALRPVASAWALSERLGCPLAEAVAHSASGLRRADAVRRAAAASAAGPRASMLVLTLLPASGPCVGWLLGVGPSRMYTGSAVTMLCLVAGCVLTAVGWWWGRRLIDRAVRPAVDGS